MKLLSRVQIIIKESIKKSVRYIRDTNEHIFLRRIRSKNKQTHCSIICNNCVGGIIYHNLGIRFDSPTINLFIKGKEYLEFCKHLEYYSSCEMVQSQDSMKDGYPIGALIPNDDEHIPVKIYFQHYRSFEEAKAKWIERFKRVDYDNTYYIWEFYDTVYDISLMYEFDNLPLDNKIIITHRQFPELKNAFCISCYKDDKPTAKILEYDVLTGKRYLDEFDYVEFINHKS